MPQIRLACQRMDVVGLEASIDLCFGLADRRRTQAVWYSWFEDIAAQCAKNSFGNGIDEVVKTGEISLGRLAAQLASCSQRRNQRF